MSETGPDLQWESCDDPAVVDAILAATRLTNQTMARCLDGVGELAARREAAADGDELKVRGVCDWWESAAAEISAARGITRHTATKEMRIAAALRDRLPKIAALFRAGDLTYAVVSTITWRTHLVEDDAILLIDTALADSVEQWSMMSNAATIRAVDAWVLKFDPSAIVRTREQARSRDVCFGKPDDATGVASLWGALLAADAAVLKARLTQMAKGVCRTDPRTLGQRRADALGALGAGADTLACQCGAPDCAAALATSASHVTIHVVADQDTLDTPPDPQMSGRQPWEQDDDEDDGCADSEGDEPTGESTEDTGQAAAETQSTEGNSTISGATRAPQTPAPTDESATDIHAEDTKPETPEHNPYTDEARQQPHTAAPHHQTEPSTPRESKPAPHQVNTSAASAQPAPEHEADTTPATEGNRTAPSGRGIGLIIGHGVIPAAMVADLARRGATIRYLTPRTHWPAEPRHRPSTALSELIKVRDLTCRFPLCDHPATHCDCDHTTPYTRNAVTHPSGCKCLCRRDHLIKTFWAGWTDHQAPDGTLTWTSPTGHTYSTTPGSRLLFPRFCLDTGPAPTGPPHPGYHHGPGMPMRTTTRLADRQARITYERHLTATTQDPSLAIDATRNRAFATAWATAQAATHTLATALTNTDTDTTTLARLRTAATATTQDPTTATKHRALAKARAKALATAQTLALEIIGAEANAPPKRKHAA